MPLPTVTITGSWVKPNNTPATGQVILTPITEVTGGGSMVTAAPIVVPLVGGAISQAVVSNAQATSLRYLVTEQVTGAPAVSYVVVPAGTTLDLSTATRYPAPSGALPNPNRPLLTANVDFTQGPPNLPGPKQMSVNAPSRRNAVRKIGITRGRQYELDQMQAGTATLEITDPLEYLHPSNAASPFMTGGNTIDSYRCIQIGAFWNASAQSWSGNLLNATNVAPASVAYDPSFEAGRAWYEVLAGAPTMAQSSAQAYEGAHSLAVGFTSATDALGASFLTAPGVIYTASLHVYVPSGATVTMQFKDSLSGTVLAAATSTVTGGWQRLTATGAALDAVSLWSVAATASTYPATVYVDAVQAEIGPTASAFTTAGPTYYPMYTGYVERFPLSWDMQGTRGIRPLTAVDALSVLSRTEINQSYSQTILADNPTVYIPYNDDAFPQAVHLPAGGQPPYGYTQIGSNSSSVNFGGDTFLDGSKAVSLVQQNTDPPVQGDNTQATYLGTRQGLTAVNTQSYTLEVWFKATLGTPFLGLAAMAPGETTVGEDYGPNGYLGFATWTTGEIYVWGRDPAGTIFMNTLYASAGIKPFADGVWHYWVIRGLGGNQFDFWRDLASTTVHTYGTVPQRVIGINNIFIDATTGRGDPVTQLAVANLAVYPTALSNAQLASHYQRGTGYEGEVSGARVLRLLTQYWGGNINVAPGHRQMSPDFDYNTRFLLDVLQEIQETERGLLYVDRAGTVQFEDSTTRAKMQGSQWVFGENPPGANPVEYPYADVAQDFDPTYTFSQTNLTRPGNSSYPPQINSTAAAKYGQRVLSQELMVNTDFDLSEASRFYLNRYSSPRLRVETLKLNPAANPALWPVVLSLEVSQRITVKRRTNALTTSNDYYIEQINHQIDAETSSWTVELQCSPVFNTAGAWVLGDPTYGVLGSTTAPVY